MTNMPHRWPDIKEEAQLGIRKRHIRDLRGTKLCCVGDRKERERDMIQMCGQLVVKGLCRVYGRNGSLIRRRSLAKMQSGTN